MRGIWNLEFEIWKCGVVWVLDFGLQCSELCGFSGVEGLGWCLGFLIFVCDEIEPEFSQLSLLLSQPMLTTPSTRFWFCKF